MPLAGPAARAVIAGPCRVVPLAGPRGRPAARLACGVGWAVAGPPRERARRERTWRVRNRFGGDLLRGRRAGRDAVAGTMPRSVL